MTSLILIAIIIDRSGTPMRSIAFAASAILIVTPEAILDVGFQMSFASVIALISSYTLASNFTKKLEEIGIITKCVLYFFGIVFSSLIAGAATAPFTIYSFNNFSSYGVITNLLAIPITSFIVMPFGIITLLLMPFGLEIVGLAPMTWAINLTSQIAKYIASLPQATGSIAQLSDISFGLIITGGIWLCFWKTKLRMLGAAPIFIGVILALLPQSTPDILIDGEGKLFAVKIDNQLLYSTKQAEKYSRET
jgi:competence protein ComEC